MDFFDPKKQKRHAIRLGVGYALLALALLLATTILLYQAYGWGIDKSGKVIQNGLVFMSSQPSSADIYVNGEKYKSQTNTRMELPAGQYTVQLNRSGYRTWQRAISVEGGSLQRFDYPMLLPQKLVTSTTKQYAVAPSLSAQSLDRRWLLVAGPNSNDFDLYDLNVGKDVKAVPKVISVSADLLSAGTTTTGWQLEEWAGDNRHVLLQRSFTKDSQTGSEYILLDSQSPDKSQNLTQLLGFNPSKIELRNRAYDQYFAYDETSQDLFTATLKKPTPQIYLERVLNFTTDGNTVLYATSQDAPAGKTLIRLRQNTDSSYLVRSVPANTYYLLDLATYSGTPYVAAGAQSDNRVFVYKDPLASLKDHPATPPAPISILKATAPNYAVFSTNARFVMAEAADHFAVYDAETDKSYAYQLKAAPDAPQLHAAWMDGYHLDFITGGKLEVFDFDGTNVQSLAAADAGYVPIFDHDYHFLYAFTGQNALTRTALLTPQDQ